LEAAEVLPVVDLSSSPIDPAKEVCLHVSPGGNLLAIANTKGRQGLVLELETGKTLMRLQRDDYHTDACTFPLAFFMHQGRELLVHGTEWNRLDISDPRTGRLQTRRKSPKYRHALSKDDHYHDYFHSSLSVSPGSRWIVDNGWVWQPWGVLMSWSLETWIAKNRWESEDGGTMRTVYDGEDWDRPVAWIDDHRLAVWGFIDEWNNDRAYPAIFLFNLTDSAWEGSFQDSRFLELNGAGLVYDEFLFGYSDLMEMTTVVDLHNGQILFQEESHGFETYHRPTKSFVSYLGDGTFRISRFQSSPLTRR
jgi:hypothetical protein